MNDLAVAPKKLSRTVLELIQKLEKTGIAFSKQEATTPPSIWDPTSCSIKIPIQAWRQLRLRWAQRGWIRREIQTLLTRQRSEDTGLAASASGSYKWSQALIKPWSYRSITQSAAGLLHWGLQTSFQSCFGLPKLLWSCDLVGSLIIQGQVSPELVVLENKSLFSTCSEGLMKIMRDRHCLKVWTPYRHQSKYIFWNGISATCPTNVHIQSMTICKGLIKYSWNGFLMVLTAMKFLIKLERTYLWYPNY